MAYQALARKWRPRNFGELVGQEHVVRTLTHALETGRLHHAYLFTGTRGVGKTTLARIFAKALNCESRRGFEPCGACNVCRTIDEGRFVDLIEVDAASRTKVEDTRELMENVLYAPAQGRFKVYLIDEVHMLSGHSFNALLKTLEEPPIHIKFLLATTDPQKIPVTVLSRCLQFNLRRLSPEQIAERLRSILQHEAIDFDGAAVKALARAADGSLRDGLSLLDQAIVHGGGRLEAASVSEMLGTVDRRPVFALLEALIGGDGPALVREVDALAAAAPNFADVLQQLLILLHHAALAQWVPEAIADDDDAERLLRLAELATAEDLQLFYQIGLIGQRDLPLAPEPRLGFEMALLRMLAFRPQTICHTEPVAGERPAGAPTRPLATFSENRSPPAASAVQVPKASIVAPTSAAVAESAEIDWRNLIRELGLAAMTRELASNCTLEALDDGSCTLVLDPQLAHLRSQRAEATLERALRQRFGPDLKLHIRLAAPAAETPALQRQRESEERQRAAETEMEQDENVRAWVDRFDARIVPGSIKPLD